MDNKRERIINDNIDLDTLFVVLLNKIDALSKIFIISLIFLLFLFITEERIYQSSSLIHFDQSANNLLPGSAGGISPTPNLSGEKEIYKSISTINGAIDKMIKDDALEEIPSVGEIIGGLSFSVESNLMTVRLNYTDQRDTKTILNYLNEEFLIDKIENKQLRAKKGIEFVNNEIPKINILLSAAEEDLTDFRSSSGKYLIFESESRGESIDTLEERIKEIEFKELELKEFYKPTHPIYLTLIEQKNILKDELVSMEENIKDIPSEQRTLFNLQQKVNIYSSSLETLEKQKLDLNLTAASSISNIRIVNAASDAFKISPKLSIILFSFIVLIIAYIYFLIDHFITDKILSLDSLVDFLDDRKLFIGAFPLMDAKREKRTKILKDIEKNNLDRSVISVLETNDKVNIILSMKGGVGKTYFSIKMFEKIASLGKKVCLVDFDLRKKGLSFTYTESEYDYLDYDEFEKKENNFQSCIIKRPDIKDPVKFFSDVQIDDFFNKLRNNFDYVLVDTPPLGTFIDSKLLSSKVDSLIVILASHFSTFGEIKTVNKEINSLNNEGIETKYFLNKVKYFLEIFKFRIRYPLYGHYGYYDTYYNVRNDTNLFTLNAIRRVTKIYYSKVIILLKNYLKSRK